MATLSTVLFCNGLISSTEKCFCGIYGIQNNITKKWYVGESIHVMERIKDYLGTIQSAQKYIKSAFEKYGKNNFTCYKLEECSVDELASKELYWSIKLKSLAPNGYNLKVGKNSCQIYSEDSREKMSKSHIGKKQSVESNIKRSEWGKNNYNKVANRIGKSNSEESNKKRSIALIGNTNNNGKHSIGNKYALGNTHRNGTKHTEESKIKMSTGIKLTKLIKWLEKEAPWFCDIQIKENT